MKVSEILEMWTEKKPVAAPAAQGVGSGIIIDKNYQQAPAPVASKPLAKQPVPAAGAATGMVATPKVAAPAEAAHFNPAQYVDLLTKLARQRGITATNDLSNFLGQCKIETANFTRPAEKFAYSDPKWIYRVFTSQFRHPNDAIPYVNNPVALANRGLAGKNGNGDEASGDGWKYRGRGFLHITGRGLYAQVGAIAHPENPSIYVNNPELLSSDPKEAALASIVYFQSKVGKGKTAKQTTKVVNPAGLKSKERAQAATAMKQQLIAKR